MEQHQAIDYLLLIETSPTEIINTHADGLSVLRYGHLQTDVVVTSISQALIDLGIIVEVDDRQQPDSGAISSRIRFRKASLNRKHIVHFLGLSDFADILHDHSCAFANEHRYSISHAGGDLCHVPSLVTLARKEVVPVRVLGEVHCAGCGSFNENGGHQ